MNPELPKSIRSALAQKGSLTTHPSADVLTAFAEHTLTMGENERVADHLAGCSECREVLFLASDVDEQFTAEATPEARAAWKPRARWMPKLAWVASGAVGLAIIGGIGLQQYVARDRSNRKAVQVTQMAPEQLPVAPPSPERSYMRAIAPKTEKSTGALAAKPPRADSVSHQASDMAAMKPSPPSTAESSTVAGAALPKPANQPPGVAADEGTSSLKVAAPTQNAFAESPDGPPAHGFASTQLQGAPLALMRQGVAAKTWRVTPEGHLEHLSATGWTSALADKPVKFRVVAGSPSGIWAGGGHGELFHSEDGGENWSEIALPIPPDGKNDAIVAIHFADLQHGLILTESAARYSTSDGGKNWQRE